MLCALFAPVTPQVAAALVVSNVVPHTAQVAVHIVTATDATHSLAVSQPVVCGVQTDTVGEWLSQSVCEDVVLEVTQADTAGIRVAVTDTPTVAKLALQHTPATVRTAHVQAGSVPSRTVMDSPVPLAVRSPRSFALVVRVGYLSVAEQGLVGASAPVQYSLRC